MATAEALMTAEEFGRMPDDGRRIELSRGRIVELPPPNYLHGKVCYKVAVLIGSFVDLHQLGQILMNDSGIVTRRNPDTVRGADVAYYSYTRLPKETIPVQYPEVAPDLVIEVRSPSDRWRDVLAKVNEYIDMGVAVVCVLDPEPMTAHLYYPDQPNRALGPDEELSFPECLGDFRVAVRRFFE